MASRCVWQHGLSVEEAVAAIRKHMEPQVKAAIAGLSAGGDFDLGKGPLREVKPGEAKSYYVELAPKDDDDADRQAADVTGPHCALLVKSSARHSNRVV